MLLVLICALVGKSPTSAFAIAFVPPSVEDAEVHDAVHQGLLATCARSLEGTCRRVHPDVNAADEATSEVHVVVFEEENLSDELRLLRDVVDALDESLASPVGRVSLACEDELYGIVGVVDNLGKAFEVGEEEVCALVGCEASCEAYEQGVRVNLVKQAYNAAWVALILEPVLAEAFADVVDEFRLEEHARFPDDFVWHVVDFLPNALVRLVVEEVCVEELVMYAAPFACAPCWVVYAVCDVSYMAFFGEISLPDAAEHLLRHFAVEPAYAVHFLAGVAE